MIFPTPSSRNCTTYACRAFMILGVGVIAATSSIWAGGTRGNDVAKLPSTSRIMFAEFSVELRHVPRVSSQRFDHSLDAAEPESPARVALREILSRPEFRPSKREESWLSKEWKRFLSWIWGIFSRVFGAANNKVVRNVVLYGAIVVAFCALAWALVRALTAAARREALRLAAAPPPGKTWSQWAREAIAAAGAGNYREAVHAAYWAGVYRLSELGAWQLDRARTPREYLRLLRASAETANAATNVSVPDAQDSSVAVLDPVVRARRADALAALTNRLEAVWYDNQSATQDDFRSAVQNLEILECRFPSIPQTANS
jgi:hypothetical protein